MTFLIIWGVVSVILAVGQHRIAEKENLFDRDGEWITHTAVWIAATVSALPWAVLILIVKHAID